MIVGVPLQSSAVNKPIEFVKKKTGIRQYQSKLQTFIEKKPQSETPPINNHIKISKFLPMKFGLRKRLQSDNISYYIIESDLHIAIHNKVLIQIYNPKVLKEKDLLTEINDFKQISSLLIIIFDFIDFSENIDGEKRVVERKIQEFAKKHNIQVICIDNEEELYFIVKNILENPQVEN